jgi:hypothetical protein
MAQFQTAYDPPAGIRLSAGLANTWAQNSMYLLGIASRDTDTATGYSIGSALHTIETTVWRGIFRYTGRKYFIHDIFWSAGTLRLYVLDDTGGYKEIHSGASAPASPLDFTNDTGANPLQLTSGNLYQVLITHEDATSAASSMSYIAVQSPNPYTFAPSNAFTTGTPNAADFASVNESQRYLQALAECAIGSSVAVGFQSSYTGSPLTETMRGAFLYNGQATFNISYMISTGRVADLTIYRNVGTDTLSLTADSTEHTSTKALTTAQYTVGNFYTFEVTHTNSSGTADATSNYVKRCWLTGTLSYTTTPYTFAEGDVVYGNGGTPSLKPACGSGATDNLTEVKNFLTATSSSPYGFQFVSPIPFGSVQISSVQYFNFGVSGVTTYTRPHVFRYLWYFPVGAGETGNFTYGTPAQTVSLPDVSGVGAACYLDLESVTTLGYGQDLNINSVFGCFEAVS